MRTFGFAIGIFLVAFSALALAVAQPPTVKAASQLVKHPPRWMYEVGEGWKIDPPYEYSVGPVGGRLAKLPTFGALWKGFAGSAGSALGLTWGCEHVELCLKKK
jgi:hypothetical protein